MKKDDSFKKPGRPGADDERKQRDEKDVRRKGKYIKETHNESSWYFKYPILATDATRLGFNHVGGKPYVDARSNTYAASSPSDQKVANVLECRYITTPGILRDTTDGFYMETRRLYLAMKRKFRGLNTYQASDLGVTLFCIAEFYRYVAKLERIYGVYKYFNVHNRTVPQLLSAALGVDSVDIMANLADFRAGINALIVKAATLCMPKGLSVLERWFLLESNIFTDSKGDRCSYIVFNDYGRFYTYQPAVVSSGGAAMLSKIGGTAQTKDNLLKAGNDLLDILLNDDDITLQLGDVISYYTQANGGTPDLLVLSEIPEDYVVVPAFNEEILLQVHNSRVIGEHFATNFHTYGVESITVDTTKWDSGSGASWTYFTEASATSKGVFMGQINNVLQYELTLCNGPWVANMGLWRQFTGEGNHIFLTGNALIDTWKDAPTPEDVMEMTRLIPNVKLMEYLSGDNRYSLIEVKSCGTELVTSYCIHTSASTNNVIDGLGNVVTMATWTVAAKNTIGYMSQFDWCPLRLIRTAYVTSDTSQFTQTFGDAMLWDVDNARVLHCDDLDVMHDVAVMSLFNIPSIQGLK